MQHNYKISFALLGVHPAAAMQDQACRPPQQRPHKGQMGGCVLIIDGQLQMRESQPGRQAVVTGVQRPASLHCV